MKIFRLYSIILASFFLALSHCANHEIANKTEEPVKNKNLGADQPKSSPTHPTKKPTVKPKTENRKIQARIPSEALEGERLVEQVENSNFSEGDSHNGLAPSYIVEAYKLNIRDAPSLQGNILGQLHKGQIVYIVQKKGRWAQIGPKKWVFINYIKSSAGLRSP